jgi:multisite-specific tRNA:(cytosine-C5)-methyltransferase
LIRNPEGDPSRSIYLTNDIVKTIIAHNDYARLRLTFAGTKIFLKHDLVNKTGSNFRIVGEGLPVVLPYIEPSTIITVDAESLRRLVEEYYPLCENFVEPFKGEIEARGELFVQNRYYLGELM